MTLTLEVFYRSNVYIYFFLLYLRDIKTMLIKTKHNGTVIKNCGKITSNMRNSNIF